MGNHRKKRLNKRKGVVRERLKKRREASQLERKLQRKQVDSESQGKTIKLAEKAPKPPRNGPCPMHPEYKLKKCPHGCIDLFNRHRSRVAGDVTVVPVDPEDKKAGKLAREIDPATNTLAELSQITGGSF